MRVIRLLIIGACVSIGGWVEAHTPGCQVELEALEMKECNVGLEMASLKSENSDSVTYKFQLTSDMIRPEKKDAYGNLWRRGFLTEKNEVKLGYSSDDPRIASVEIAVMDCNIAFPYNGSYTTIVKALEQGLDCLDVQKVGSGETVSLKISKPGRNSVGYLVKDSKDSVLYKGQVGFDALYDDGKWEKCGEAELTSDLLAASGVYMHLWGIPNGGSWPTTTYMSGLPCPVDYPYYKGESWKVMVDYHPELKRYRIVNPLTSNEQFKDFTVNKEETLAYVTSKGRNEYPEAFLFDTENPSWFILNAEKTKDAYCEPTSIGMMVIHNAEGKDFFAPRYNELEGVVKYVDTPVQSIEEGEYFECPMKPELSLIRIKFDSKTFNRSGDSGIENIEEDQIGKEIFYTLDGVKVDRPSTGLYLKRKGSKVSKVIL